MKRICCTTMLLFGCYLSLLTAQTAYGICSTPNQHEILDRLSTNRVQMANFSRPRNAITYVPVKAQLVARSDGTGRVSEVDVLEMLCVINQEYAEQEIQFYFSNGFRYVNSSSIYSNPSGSSQLILNNKVNNAINIFIVGKYSDDGAQAFYQSQGDYIVSDKLYIRAENVLPHELGHFFSLAHPFYGWEGHPYDPDEHGNPVGLNAPSDPLELGNVGSIRNENQSGSNCTFAADRICDTPPDYLFAFSNVQNNNCMEYNGNTMDPEGVVVNPIEQNMMSYFAGCDDYTFTNDQKTAIELDLFSPARNYIRPNFTPNTTEITEDATLLAPINNEITPGYNNVKLEWEAPAGAEAYIVQIDELPTFNFKLQQFVVEGQTFLEITSLEPGRTYHWRVRPYNELHSCRNFSTRATFVTGPDIVNVNNIEAVSGWTVMPNPVQRHHQLEIQLNANEVFDAQIKIYSMAGQLVQAPVSQRFIAGANNLQLETGSLYAGMYFLMIESNQGVLSEKVVIMD